jgi:4-amino-4-deoxy-L-arabinose transferase-like glycosyltransferase
MQEPRFRILPWQDLALCAGVMALALLARVWNLSGQSVWYDEWITLRALDAPSLLACLRIERELDWSMVPAYHVIEYYWARWISGSPLGLRWLSLLFSMASFPLLYAIALRHGGRWVAVTALLFMALAPLNIFHAQGIRNYPLALLAGLASQYAFMRAIEPGAPRRWWWLNFAANVLLVWTHLFGALLFAAQGLFLLAFRRSPRLWLRWGLPLVVALLPLAAWQATSPGNANYPTVPRPPLKALPDLINKHYTHPHDWADYNIPMEDTYGILSETGAVFGGRSKEHNGLSLRMRMGAWLEWTTKWMLLAFALLTAYHLWRPRQPDERRQLAERAFLLFAWVAVPTLCLFALAWIFAKPVAFVRYLIPAYPALYIMLGIVVSKPPFALVRSTLLLVLAGLLAVQAIAYQVIPIRSDYLSVVSDIRAGAQPAERIYTMDYNAENLLRFNLNDPSREIILASGYEHLFMLLDEAAPSGEPFWVMLHSLPQDAAAYSDDAGRAEKFMADCTARGWTHTYTAHGGMVTVWLFRVTPTPSGA